MFNLIKSKWRLFNNKCPYCNSKNNSSYLCPICFNHPIKPNKSIKDLWAFRYKIFLRNKLY